MNRKRQACRNNAFTLIELLVVISIIALLIAILLPTLSRAKESARVAVCLANLKQGALAVIMYADDNNTKMPLARATDSSGSAISDVRWYYFINPYIGGRKGDVGFGRTFSLCPSQDTGTGFYGVNYASVFGSNFSASLARLPSTVFLMADIWGPSWDWGSGYVNYYNVILNANAPAWAYDGIDWDNDGVDDSNSGEIGGVGPYNGCAIIHNGNSTTNVVLSDGSAKTVRGSSFANNEGGLWGKGDTSYK